MPFWGWMILFAVHTTIMIVWAIKVRRDSIVEGYMDGYKDCVVDSCKYILHTELDSGATFATATKSYKEWLNKGVGKDNFGGIKCSVSIVDDNELILELSGFGEVFCKIKEVKDGDVVDE